MSRILVIADHDGATLKPATLSAVAAATQISGEGGEVHVLVAGLNVQGAVRFAQAVPGIASVLHADHAMYEHGLAEDLANLIVALGQSYTHLLAPATSMGKSVMPRVAALLDVGQVSDIVKVVQTDTFVRPVCAGALLTTVRMHDAIKVITVRASAFAAVATSGGAATVVSIAAGTPLARSEHVSTQRTVSTRPELASARVVVAGGKGLQSSANFRLLEELADVLGGAVGASRAAVDLGYARNECQVGQTGQVVAPDLYIAVGISGAVQHVAGMKDSKVIVAIDKDENAPIFALADYGLVGDLFDIVPNLTQALRGLRDQRNSGSAA